MSSPSNRFVSSTHPLNQTHGSKGPVSNRFFSYPLRKQLGAGLCVVLLASCGTQEKEGGLCTVTLNKESSSETLNDMRKVAFRGDLSAECKELYTNQSGRAGVKVSVTSPKSPGSYLSSLQAGDRSFAFGSNFSLAQGSSETLFSSDTLKSWAFPWPDKPGTMSLVVLVPLTLEEKDWPTAASVELKAGN